MAVEIEMGKDRIHVWFPYSAADVEKVRRIAGRSFVKKPSPHWTVPLNMQSCRDLRKEFGKDLAIGPELTQWAREQVAAEETGAALGAVSLAAFTEARLENCARRAPALYERMAGRPYQIPAAAFIATRRGALLGDQPGLGKTTEIMGGIVERFPDAPANVIIVSPATSVMTVWKPELEAWMPEGTRVWAAVGGRAAREAVVNDFMATLQVWDRPQYMVLCVNAEMLQTKVSGGKADDSAEAPKNVTYTPKYPQLFSLAWDAQVVDEGHKYLITRYSQTHNVKMSQVRRGLARLPLATNGVRVAGSGTPFKGRTQNFWGTLNWLSPKQSTSFWTWASSYLEIDDNGYGKTVGDLRADRKDDFYRSLTTTMIRRTKNELRTLNPAWAPPAKMYEQVRCVMDAKQEKQYRAMESDAAVNLGDVTVTANGVLAEMTRLKQLAHAAGEFREGKFVPALPSAKFTQMLQMLEERGISGDEDVAGEGVKVVIGSQFTQMLNLYSRELKRLGIDHFLLTGETPSARRTEMQRAFQQPGGPRVFMINTQAGGVSITLDAADELWVLDETWVPDEQEQLEDRVHRTSNVDHQVTISYFTTAGTIEEEIAQITAEKDESQKRHLDGRRGVEFARQWAQQKIDD